MSIDARRRPIARKVELISQHEKPIRQLSSFLIHEYRCDHQGRPGKTAMVAHHLRSIMLFRAVKIMASVVSDGNDKYLYRKSLLAPPAIIFMENIVEHLHTLVAIEHVIIAAKPKRFSIYSCRDRYSKTLVGRWKLVISKLGFSTKMKTIK